MCGIFGFVGKSSNPHASFEFANALLMKTERRGEHATGFWACERGDGRLFYDKEPVKSSVYATRDIWAKQFAEADCDLLIAHCRFTSVNVGHEKFNKNNHPHASGDKRVALVHNGKIPEYSALKSRYDLHSDCDSEILLGMFESGDEYKNKEDYLKQEFPTMTPDVAYRMMGLKEVFSRVNYGAMAVAIGERGENARSRFLWLFRDDERPLYVIDMRKTLGQIFFCSEAEIWRSAVEICPAIKPYMRADQVIIEFPPYQVWLLASDPNATPELTAWEQLKEEKDKENKPLYESKEDVPEDVWTQAVSANEYSWRTKKFRITKTKFYDWKQEDDDNVKITRAKSTKPAAKLVTRLFSADEEIMQPKKDETKPEARPVDENNGPVPNLSTRECRALVSAPANKKKPTVIVPSTTALDDDYLARHAASSKDEALEELSETTITETEINMEDFESMITAIHELVADIDTNVKNLHKEGSLTPKDFGVIMESLKDAQIELKGSMIFLK